MKHLAFALLVLAGCGSDTRPPIDASIDAPIDASIDAPVAVVDAPVAVVDAPRPDASGLPEASPNYGAPCTSNADCTGGAPCRDGVCHRSCFLGACPEADLHCHQDHCTWLCSDAYTCPATTTCTQVPGYEICL